MRVASLIKLLFVCVGVSAETTIHRPIPREGLLKSTRWATSFRLAQNSQVEILKDNHNVSNLRGGGCSDSNPALFAKIGISAAAETAAMLGILIGTHRLATKIQILPSIFGLPMIQWLGLLVIIFASSFLGSLVEGGLSVATNQVLDPSMVPGDPEWYSNLSKPSWNPPGWLFPIMWLIVSKPTQLIAVSRLLKMSIVAATDVDPVALGDSLPLPLLAIYCAHLSLGDAWNKVFFGLQCTGRGAATITVFYALLLASALLFYQSDPVAGLFLLPTCCWVTVATALNWSIYLKNR